MKHKFFKRFTALALSLVMLGTSMMTGTYASEDAVSESAVPSTTESVSVSDDDSTIVTSDGDTLTVTTTEDDAATDAPEASETSSDTEEAAVSTNMPEVTATPEATEQVAEVAEADVTAIQDYITENIDTQYANAEQFIEMDILLVKQTLVDKTKMSGEITIDNMWSTEENAEAYLKMDQVYMYLYDVDPDSDYFVALADTMHNDDTCVVTDYVFAYTNLWGEVVTDCIFDEKTGLAYVPKAYTTENKNECGVMNIQLQLLQACKTDEPTSDVAIEVASEVKGEVAEDGVATVDAMAFSTDIQLAENKKALENIKEDKISVIVNDVATESFSYDEETGVLTVDYAPTQIETLDVTIEKETFAEKISSLVSSLFMTEAEAASSDGSDWKPLSEAPLLTFSQTPEAGKTVITMETDVYYSGTSYDPTNTYSINTGDDGATMFDVITSNREISNYTLDLVNRNLYAMYFVADLGTPKTVTITSGSGTVKSKGIDADAIMACAHVSNSWEFYSNSSHTAAMVPGNTYSVGVKLRVMAVKEDSGGTYIIVGVYTQRDGSDGQTGVGFFKMYYDLDTVDASISKTWTYPSSATGFGDGTIYGTKPDKPTSITVQLYKDGTSMGSSYQYTLNASNSWKKTVTGLDAGHTYTWKETTDSVNWTEPTTLTASGGTIKNTAKYGAFRIHKKQESDDTNDVSALEGAQYAVYKSKTDAQNGTNPIITEWKIQANGYSTYKAFWPGTYYVKETKAPNGYLIDTNIYTVTVTEDDVYSTDVNKNKALTVDSTEKRAQIKIQIPKTFDQSSEAYTNYLKLNSAFRHYTTAGATYTLYKGVGWSSKTVVGTYTSEMDTSSIASLVTTDLVPVDGQYYFLKETRGTQMGGTVDPTVYIVYAWIDGAKIYYRVYKADNETAAKSMTKWTRIFPQTSSTTTYATIKNGGTITLGGESAYEPISYWNLNLTKELNGDPSDTYNARENLGENPLEGATYTLYYGSLMTSANGKTLSDMTAYISKDTDEDAKLTITEIPIMDTYYWTADFSNTYYSSSEEKTKGYFYLVETASPDGLEVDPYIYRIDFTAGRVYVKKAKKSSSGGVTGSWSEVYDSEVDSYSSTTATTVDIPVDLTSSDREDSFPFKLRKVSADTSVTDGNSSYSLENATYALYYSTDPTLEAFTPDKIAAAESDGIVTLVGKYKTDADGTFTVDNLEAGEDHCYYLYETSASTNYGLDKTIYNIMVYDDSKGRKYDICDCDYGSGEATWDDSNDDYTGYLDDNDYVTIKSYEPPKTTTFDLELIKKADSDTVDARRLYGTTYDIAYGTSWSEVYNYDYNYYNNAAVGITGNPSDMTSFTVTIDYAGKLKGVNNLYINEDIATGGLDKDPYLYCVVVMRYDSTSFDYVVKKILKTTADTNVEEGHTDESDSTYWNWTAVSGGRTSSTISFTSVEPTHPYYVYLTKMLESNASGKSSVAGAKYTLYKAKTSDTLDAVFKTTGTTYTTNSNGLFTTAAALDQLYADECYYVKETKASPNCTIDKTVWRITQNAKTGDYVLESVVPTEKDTAKVANALDWTEVTTRAYYNSNRGTYSTYDGYTTVVSGKYCICITSTEPPVSVSVQLTKVSSNENVSGDEYSLADATYTMFVGSDWMEATGLNATTAYEDGEYEDWYGAIEYYGSWQAALTAGGKGVEYTTAAISTDDNGDTIYGFITENLSIGETYWFVETKSSDGYLLDKTVYSASLYGYDDESGTYSYMTKKTEAGVEDWDGSITSMDTTEDVTVSADDSDAMVALTADGVELTSEEEPTYFNFNLEKQSQKTNLTDGNANYSLKNATYAIYYGESWEDVVFVDSKNTDEDGCFAVTDLAVEMSEESAGWYYIRETKAPLGYVTDKTIYAVCVSLYDSENGTLLYKQKKSTDDGQTWTDVTQEVITSGSTVTITSTEPPKYWKFNLQKKFSDEALTNGNSNYSLANAVYTLYYGKSFEEATEFKLNGETVTFTTDENGYIESGELPLWANYGYSFYLKETSSSEGCGLDTGYYEFYANNWTVTNQIYYEVVRYELQDDGTYEDYEDAELLMSGTLTDESVTFDLTSDEAASYEPPKYWKFNLRKISADESLTDGRSNYSLADATYTLYYGTSFDEATEFVMNGTAVAYSTDENGYIESGNLPVAGDGYYYFLKETSTSTGYGKDTGYYKISVQYLPSSGNIGYSCVKFKATDTGYVEDSTIVKYATSTAVYAMLDLTSNTGASYEPPKYWSFELNKASADKTVTDGNSKYSLEGAEYTLYYGTSYDAATEFTMNGDTVTYATDANGYIQSGGLPLAENGYYYYIAETKPSPGYGLDTSYYEISVGLQDSTDEIVYAATKYTQQDDGTYDAGTILENGQTDETSVNLDFTSEDATSYEPPVNGNWNLMLRKVSADESITKGNGTYSLANAEYTLYYGTSYKDKTETVTFKTNASGYIDTSSQELDFTETGYYYYLQETKSSYGYDVDTSYYEIAVSMDADGKITYSVEKYTLTDEGTYEGNTVASADDVASPATINLTSGNAVSKEPPKYWTLNLRKASADETVTDGKKQYSLEGAEYTLYYGTSADFTEASVFEMNGETVVFKTDADGYIQSDKLPITKNGCYFLKETKPSQGYGLESGYYRIYMTYASSTNRLTYEAVKFTDDPTSLSITESVSASNEVSSNSSATVSVGDNAYYTVTVKNTGSVTANNLVIDSYMSMCADSSGASGERGYTVPDSADDFAAYVYDTDGNASSLALTDSLFEASDDPSDDAYDWVLETQYDLPAGYSIVLLYPVKFTEAFAPNINSAAASADNAMTVSSANTVVTATESAASAASLADTSTTGSARAGVSAVSANDGDIIICSGSTKERSVTFDFTTKTAMSYEPVSGSVPVRVTKTSENAALTDGNSCYSLADATYAVYCGSTFANAIAQDAVLTLTTDENGVAATTEDNELPVPDEGNYYYVVETDASEGYGLDMTVQRIYAYYDTDGVVCEISSAEKDDSGNVDESAWAAVSTSTLAEGDYAEVSSSEPPANDPFALTLTKKGTANNEPISGAIFKLVYYDNTEGKTADDGETATRTWYFITKEGSLDCSDPDYLLDGDNTLNDGTTIESDGLYYEEKNGVSRVVYPVGTYVFTEIQAADGYTLDGGEMWLSSGIKVNVVDGILFKLLRNDTPDADGSYGTTLYDQWGNKVKSSGSSDNFAVNATNDADVKIKVIKRDSITNEPVPGAVFKLVGNTLGDEHIGTTDANGEISFDEGISPQEYTLTEISAPDGYTLMEDNVTFTVPLYMTEEEIEEMGADIDEAQYSTTEGKYFYVALTYTFGEGTSPVLPMTGMGNTAAKWFPLFCGFGIAGIACAIASKKKKRKEA